MNARKLISYVVLLVFLTAATQEFSLGGPPPHQDPEPGITAPQAI